MRNLTEFFVQVGGLDTGWHVSLSVIDADVPSNKHRLCKFYDFYGHEQGDWHHVGEQENPSEEGLEEDFDVSVPGPDCIFHSFN